MIRIARPPKPKILERKAEEWKRKLMAASPRKKSRALEKYRHKEVKVALVSMFSEKCAYCESKITHLDYGHIEHYRPKSGPRGRPDLTFEWTNLLLACGICNGGNYKSDSFPDKGESGPIVNPCEDDPNEHFEFRFDLASKLASVYGKSPRGETTEKLLGLNRPELRSYRSSQIRKLIVLAEFAASNAEAAELLELAKESNAEYAAFARTLFRQ